MDSARALLQLINSTFPLSKATAILDIGCGPGQLTGLLIDDYISQISAEVRIIASDLSPAMLEQVAKRKEAEIARGNVGWMRVEMAVLDALDLADVPDQSISHATASFVYFLLPEARKGLQQVRRVLSEEHGGGVFAMSSAAEAEWNQVVEFVKVVRPDKVVPALAPCWLSEEGQRAEMEAAGFREVEVRTTDLYMPFESHEAVVRFLTTTYPLMKLLAADMTEEELKKVYELMMDWIKEKYPSTPARMVGKAFIALGRK